MSDRILAADHAGPTLPIHAVTGDRLADLLATFEPASAAFVRASGFDAASGQQVLVPDASGGIAAVLFGLGKGGEAANPFLVGKLATALPEGDYRLAGGIAEPRLAALAWALGAYRFRRYRQQPDKAIRLVLDSGVDHGALAAEIEAVTLVRDLINTPSNDLGPAELAATARSLAERFGARFTEVTGDALARDFPLVHAVGQGSERAPRLVDITWGDAAHPKVTLIGKGVCFDTGGLDIKPSSGMLLMKKDMGGAASVLGLALMVMSARLPVRLRVIVPAVENAISGRAFRPSDVFRSRKGLTVEIGNTDAEGRLILADALALADEEEPALLFDLATLTGAARVALGPDLPPFYTDDDALAAAIERTSRAENDPLWRLPLWRPYHAMLDSKVADTNNVSSGGFAGSITAALFLQKFVEKTKSWAHFDIFGWTPSAKPGRPEGGEAQAIRALFRVIAERFPSRG